MSFKVTRLGPPRIKRDTITVGGTVFTAGDLAGGSSLTVEDEGTPLATDATSLDFVGDGVVASGAGANKTITIAGVTSDAVRDAGRWEVLMTPGVTFPPDPVQTVDGSDWVYGWVPG